jgi:hypothetical protein
VKVKYLLVGGKKGGVCNIIIFNSFPLIIGNYSTCWLRFKLFPTDGGGKKLAPNRVQVRWCSGGYFLGFSK